mgnify:CR=1 FL=1
MDQTAHGWSNGQLWVIVRHRDTAPFRREAVQQLRTRPVGMPEEAPAWAIAIDGDAALALVHPAGRAVHDCINEEDCVARIQVHLHRASDPVDRRARFRRHLGLAEFRVDDVGLVAAGYDHRRAIARANVVDRHQDVDLATMKPSVMIAELAAGDALMTAGMQADGLSGATDRGEILIDEQPPMKPIEIRLVGADEMGDLVDPRGMIDQLLPRFAALVDLLKVQPLVTAGEIVAMDPPTPLAGPAILKRIEAFVAGRNLL